MLDAWSALAHASVAPWIPEESSFLLVTLSSQTSGSGSNSIQNHDPLPLSYDSTWFRFQEHVS